MPKLDRTVSLENEELKRRNVRAFRLFLGFLALLGLIAFLALLSFLGAWLHFHFNPPPPR